MADLRLYALLDPEHANGHALDALAKDVVEGGVTLLQLRDKSGSTRMMIECARAIKAAVQDSGVAFVINDRVDVALAVGADGVHVGWDDMPVADARRLLGARATIGLSIQTIQQVKDAPLELLDYVCIGGVFRTHSKDNPNPPVGTDGFRALAAAIRARKSGIPVGAIAGIDETNAAEVVGAGADGIAVISALSMVDEPKAAAARLRSIVDRSLKERRIA